MSNSIKPRFPWWEFLIPGMLILAGSIFAWWYLSEVERQGGVLRLPSVAIFLYNWGGKWAIVLFLAAIGALFTSIGTWKLIKKLRERPPGHTGGP
ncbi:MAG TPA: hypothetical protein VKE98_17875 [Gemmataceae bacterium]|nr:hypothetical protein [Gemmataceae bacterium]